jgi:L-fuconolactonase
MSKIDAHQHFWRYNHDDYAWINDRMGILKRNYLPEDLKEEMDRTGIDGCIAVQARQMEEENRVLLSLAENFSFIKGIVGWVDLRSPDVNERLLQYSKYQVFKGVRHVIHDEPDPDFMLQTNFIRGISMLKEHNLTYDILIFEQHLPNTIQLVEQFPDQKFVVDHLAKPKIKDKQLEPWKSRMQELARSENVFCKMSGMVTEAGWKDWLPEDIIPFMEVVYDSFGSNRLMFGSDWPVCRLAGDYDKVFRLLDEFIPMHEKEKVFGGNAIAFYGLET